MTDTPDSPPGETWQFPKGAFISAILSAAGAGAAMLVWLLFTGMGHGARFDLAAYVGIVLLLGSAWSFFDAGTDIGLAPAASRTTRVRSVGLLSYFLAVACVAVAAWLLAMIWFL